jgi:hypothetical protein
MDAVGRRVGFSYRKGAALVFVMVMRLVSR